ncbi:MAG: hypothetical protein MMC33_007117 [Icmadophila ericetorum]|nr:hypothetical protein [Icmadophila ericetorum]
MAFTDLYETINDGSYPVSPSPIYFIARPVAGGHFSLLALLRSGQISTTGTALAGFPVDSAAALDKIELPLQASVDLGPVQVTPAAGSTVQNGLSVTTTAISRMTTITYSNSSMTMASSLGTAGSSSNVLSSSTTASSSTSASTTIPTTETLTVTTTAA